MKITETHYGLLISDTDIDIYKIANSGQCFRWFIAGDTVRVIADNKLLLMKQKYDKIALSCTKQDFWDYWCNYLDMGTNYEDFYIPIPFRRQYEFSKGIHILRQPIFETIVSFIISANNNIPRIKSIINKLCRKAGTIMTTSINGTKVKYSCFPTYLQILNKDISDIGLGYRYPYIIDLCSQIDNGLDILSLSYEQLLDIKGIGPKVANCIRLYGYHDLSAFPIDTHISKAINDFGGHIDMSEFLDYAGVIQQYMFYYQTHGGSLNEKR